MIHYSVNLTNKGNKAFVFFFLSFFSFSWYQTFNKKLITTRNSTHSKEFLSVFISPYQRMKKLFYTLSCIKYDVYILSLSISYVCLVIILLILWVIPPWDSAPAHSSYGKELNPSYQEDANFSGFAHRQNNFNLSCIIPLWDSVTAHTPSGRGLNPSSQVYVHTWGRCTLTN